jgi:NADH-quinone oxidoreductase subunit H
VLAPFLTLYFSFIGWAVIPFSTQSFVINLNIGILYLLIISSFSVYGILLAGWSSNSKYAFLAAIRSVAQAISYEVSIALIILPVILMSNTLNLIHIVLLQNELCWFCLPLFPLCVIFFISILAETNRTPFDLAEAEAELVAGYNIEYSGILFAAFFLGEYANIFLMSSLYIILFFGGWDFFGVFPELIFSIKIVFVAFFFIFIRANVPRYRFDQLMSIGWKVFLPFVLGFFFFVCGLVKVFINIV